MRVSVRATVVRLLGLVEAGDLEAKRDQLGECFAPDARYHVQVPALAVVRGPTAIADELVRQTAHYSSLRCEIGTVVAEDGSVVVERIDHLVLPNGAAVDNELVAVFDGDAAGRITGWREYWDSAALGQRIQAAAPAGHTDEEQ